MNRRQVDRFRRRLPVHFWRPGDSYHRKGFTNDISTSGMFIAAGQPLPKGSRIRVEIGPSERGFIVEGEVAHYFENRHQLAGQRPTGMGVHFLPLAQLLRNLVPELAGSDEEGEEESPSTSFSFRVTYTDPRAFLEVYDRDIATGGFFVASRRPAALGAEVTVVLSVLGIALPPLSLSTRVVHRIEPAEVLGDPNLMAGMGLEILDLAQTLRFLEPLVRASRG